METFFITITTVLIVLTFIKLIKGHIHILPPATYIVEKYYSLFKDDYIYRISTPGKIFFSFNKHPFVKKVIIPGNTQHLFCDGILEDFTEIKLRINYNISITKDQEKLKNIYNSLPRRHPKEAPCMFESAFSLYFNAMIREFLSFHSAKHFYTAEDAEKFRDELIESIRTETNKFFEISIIGLGIDIGLPMVYDTKRKAADMNIESLTESDYSLQQINQILKANDEGIILSAINPIVPERVFRKIREKYKTNKEKMDQFIEQLSIKTKTQEDIDKICEEIISL